MRVITPVSITDAMLLACSISEPDTTMGEALWNAATSYTVGQRVIRTTTHRVYENLIAGVNATLPENATGGATPRWLEIGPTNRWAMFDNSSSTESEAAESLTFTLSPGYLSDIAAFEIAADSMTVSVVSNGSTIFSATEYLNYGTTNWHEFFFSRNLWRTVATITGIQNSVDPVVSVTFDAPGGVVRVGVFCVGTSTDVGLVRLGARISTISYSRKETDQYGNTSFVKRGNSSRISVGIEVENAAISSLKRKLDGLDAVPCAWIGLDEDQYELLSAFGFYRDLSIEIPYPSVSLLSLEIERLI